MARLYPPHIEGALPAFCGNALIIPFEHSRAVSQSEITGYHYILKDIQQSMIVTQDQVSSTAASKDNSGNWELSMQINTSQLSPGTFYKLQLAYVKNSQTGFFSDVGIIKYIQKPEVKIIGLNQSGINNHTYQYQLEYKCNDSTEKLYSTEFILARGSQDNPIDTSGEIIHNTNNDSYYEGHENYEFLQELDPRESYWIYARIKTTSGYETTTPFYPLAAEVGIPIQNGRVLNPVLDFDNGCISLYTTSNASTSITGQFRLVRADEKENFAIWHRLVDLSLSANNITTNNPYLLWRDFTVEQGSNYIYALMQKNDAGHYSSKIKTDVIYADFEDSFLFDGDHQLRIRFDPKVSSFKITVQEAKTDTIGGRYPIIQRNGYTNYKEFPISGLISHLSDPDGYFNQPIAQIKYLDNETVVTDTTDAVNGMNYTTNLNGKNVALERTFKLQVLDWLNNGKPKLFRSPTEGNYLVRLLNVSLSPIDTLGRMLHSFSATAYEIDESTPEKLIKHNILKDQYLTGRYTTDLDRNFISYYLSNLDNRNLLNVQSELKGKEVTGAVFTIQPTLEKVYVNINGEDVEVSDSGNAKYDATITSLKAPTSHASSYHSHDLVTLTYKNVLSNEAYNNFIDKIISIADINQYTGGFNYLNNFGDIKNFLQKIYKMICNVRPVVENSGTRLTLDLLINILDHLGLSGLAAELTSQNWISKLHGMGANVLKEVIETVCGGTCIASIAYKIIDDFGNVIGYIDGNKCAWIKEGGQIVTGLAKATVSFLHSSGIAPSVYNIVKETIFKDTDFDSTITNIIANPFTCVDIIYKTGVNAFNALTGRNTGDISSSQTVSSQNVIGAVSTAAQSLTPTVVATCENIYNTFVNGSGGDTWSIPSAAKTVVESVLTDGESADKYTAVNNIIQGTASAGAALAGYAIDVLENSNIGNVTNLINIPASVMSGISSAFNGLFGGMC